MATFRVVLFQLRHTAPVAKQRELTIINYQLTTSPFAKGDRGGFKRFDSCQLEINGFPRSGCSVSFHMEGNVMVKAVIVPFPPAGEARCTSGKNQRAEPRWRRVQDMNRTVSWRRRAATLLFMLLVVSASALTAGSTPAWADPHDDEVASSIQYALNSRGVGVVWVVETRRWRAVALRWQYISRVAAMAPAIEGYLNNSGLAIRNGKPQYSGEFVTVADAASTYLIPRTTLLRDSAGRVVHTLLVSRVAPASSKEVRDFVGSAEITYELRLVRAQVSALVKNTRDRRGFDVEVAGKLGIKPPPALEPPLPVKQTVQVAIQPPAPKPTPTATPPAPKAGPSPTPVGTPTPTPKASPKPRKSPVTVVPPVVRPPASPKAPKVTPPPRPTPELELGKIIAPKAGEHLSQGAHWIRGKVGSPGCKAVRVKLGDQVLVASFPVRSDGTWACKGSFKRGDAPRNIELSVTELDAKGNSIPGGEYSSTVFVEAK